MVSKEKERVRRKILQWYLKFIQEDFDKLPAEELYQYRMNVRFMIIPPFVSESSVIKEESSKKEDSDGTLRQIHERAGRFFQIVLKLVANKNNTEEIELPDVSAVFRMRDDFSEVEYVPIIKRRSETWEIMAVHTLAHLLKGVPRKAYKTCRGCGQYFINFTEREKFYCSTTCAWKDLSKKRREELQKHPKKRKARLDQQRKAMRENRSKIAKEEKARKGED